MTEHRFISLSEEALHRNGIVERLFWIMFVFLWVLLLTHPTKILLDMPGMLFAEKSCIKNHPSQYSARAQKRLERRVGQYPPRTPRLFSEEHGEQDVCVCVQNVH
ncbi:hypothetical protein TNCV_3600781 [Trichonephila clavipes]|nr:hypothetical protein TNCV_3600781 [Trichonephila clavipes]